MEPITEAERKLFLAASSGYPCDFQTESEQDWLPTAKDAQTWGDDRVVRGAFLRDLTVASGLAVNLVGARIDGNLDLRNCIVELAFDRCIFAGDANFDGATFARDANFGGATFTRDAIFDGATFTRDAIFGGATFTDHARFDIATFTRDARFNRATFTAPAYFGRATFTAHAWFAGATFTDYAWFGGATFTDYARFDRATFTHDAIFDGATFTRDARFDRATFTHDAIFDGATFTRDANFDRATFTDYARFSGATFTRDANFDGATFTRDAEFSGATFTRDTVLTDARCGGVLELSSVVWNGAAEFEGLCAAYVLLDGSVFREAVRLDITAGLVSAVRLRAEKRIHLVVASASVDLTDADLAADSLIEAVPLPSALGKNGRWVESTDRGTLATVEWLDVQIAHSRLNQTLTKALPAGATASITSLQRARVADTTISGMILRDCSFSDVHGLDELRIADVQVLRSSKEKNPGWLWPVRFRSKRRLIVDELDVRGVATTLSPATDSPQLPPEIRPLADPLPTARAAAGAYRAIRKGLEDSKDEPGAADFYYGEMEMRRRAAGRVSAERALLTLYWFISGYGLRALRALTCLGVVIAFAGWCFTNSDWYGHRQRPRRPRSSILTVPPGLGCSPAEKRSRCFGRPGQLVSPSSGSAPSSTSLFVSWGRCCWPWRYWRYATAQNARATRPPGIADDRFSGLTVGHRLDALSQR